MTQQTQDFNRPSSQTTKTNPSTNQEPSTGKVGNNVEKDEPRAQGGNMKSQA